MDAAVAHSQAPSRGATLLLAHCAALDDEARPEPGERLAELVGSELAKMLVSALAPSRGARVRDLA